MIWFILCSIISLIVGFCVSHFGFPNVITKIETVYKEVPKVIIENPTDFDNYLEWKKHEKEYNYLLKIIGNDNLQDDDKFMKIKEIVDKEISRTEGGEFGSRF